MAEKLYPATAMPDRDWWSVLWPDPDNVLRRLGIRPGMTVVDLCCGDGHFTAPLGKLVDGRVYAIDIDPRMIAQAQAECRKQGSPVGDWICGDASEIADLVSSPVDFVLMANTFHGVPDKLKLARAVAAALKPGGRFAIVNWRPLPREETVVLNQPRGPKTAMRMAPDDLKTVLERGDFDLSEVIDLPPYHYGAVFQKSGGEG